MPIRGFARRRSPSPRRRTIVAGCLALSLPILTACGANFGAQTNQVYQPAQGVNDRAGDVFVINALIVTDGSGNGTVVASLINQSRDLDTLLEVQASATNDAPLESSDLGEGIELPPEQAVQLADGAEVRVSGSEQAVDPESEEETGGVTGGSFVQLSFVFKRASVVQVLVPVLLQGLPANTMYDDIPVGPAVDQPAA